VARKGRRRNQRRPAQRPASGASPAATPARPQSPGRVGGEQAAVRSVEMSLAPRATTRRSTKSQRLVLEDADPAIPIDRVPYFVEDLKRLGIVAGAMVVLMLGAAQLIPLVVH
jgi:hypothetical protein